MDDRLHPMKLAQVRPAGPNGVLARLEGGDGALYEAHALPGLTVRLRAGGKGPFPIALASQPARRWLEVLVDRREPLGEAVAALAPGAEVEVSAPYGTGFPAFDFRRHDLYLVGHALGLAPVRAAVLHALTERGAFDHVRVLAEARFLDEIPFRDEFPAWQRAGVRVYQVLARPDMGKWARGEGAYVWDVLRELGPDPARSVVLASGPEDMLRGVQGVLRGLRLPPERLFLHELATAEPERAREADRPAERLGKITPEGVFGSGHQPDAPDHAPGFSTPREQPRGIGPAPYQRPEAKERAH